MSTLMIFLALAATDLEADLLQDRLTSYDVFYKVTLSINLRTLPTKNETDPVYARPLRPGEEPKVIRMSFRCRKQGGLVRLEEFIEDRLKSVAVLAEGNLQIYSPFDQTHDIMGQSGNYCMEGCAYDNYRFLMYDSTTVDFIVRRRRAKGFPVELLPGPKLRIGPGDNSTLQLSNQQIEIDFDPQHGLAPRQIAFSFPGNHNMSNAKSQGSKRSKKVSTCHWRDASWSSTPLRIFVASQATTTA